MPFTNFSKVKMYKNLVRNRRFFENAAVLEY
jgi:hypothetical protein